MKAFEVVTRASLARSHDPGVWGCITASVNRVLRRLGWWDRSGGYSCGRVFYLDGAGVISLPLGRLGPRPSVPVLQPHHIIQVRGGGLEDLAVGDCLHLVDHPGAVPEPLAGAEDGLFQRAGV